MKNSATDLKRRKAVASIGALGLAGLPLTLNAQQSPRYGIDGEMAPELSLDYWIDSNGDATSFSVTDQRGKWLLLKCFQDWCPGCHSSGFPTLKAFATEFAEHPKVAMAGIQTVFEGFTTNTIDDVRKNQLRYELPIVMGHDAGDPDGDHRPQTMRKYRTGGTPWLILINPDGRVVYNHFHVDQEKTDRIHSSADQLIAAIQIQNPDLRTGDYPLVLVWGHNGIFGLNGFSFMGNVAQYSLCTRLTTLNAIQMANNPVSTAPTA